MWDCKPAHPCFGGRQYFNLPSNENHCAAHPNTKVYLFNTLFEFAKVAIKQSLDGHMSGKDVMNGVEAMIDVFPKVYGTFDYLIR